MAETELEFQNSMVTNFLSFFSWMFLREGGGCNV